MINTLNEEIRIIILLIVYGINLAFVYELINIISSNFRKETKIFIETCLWLIQIYLSYLFVYKMASGYMPIYFVIYIIIGVIIYLVFNINKQITNVLMRMILIILKIIKYLTILLIEAVYPNYLKEINNYHKKRLKKKKEKDIVRKIDNESIDT